MIEKYIQKVKAIALRSVRTTSKEFVIFSALLILLLVVNRHFVANASYLPLIDEGYYGDIPDSGGSNPSNDGIVRLESAVKNILLNVRYVIGAVAIAIFVYAGSMMVFKGGDEAEITKQKSTLTYAVIGMAVIGVAGAVTELLSVEGGGFINPEIAKERAIGFRVEVNLIITFIKYLLGSIATLFLVITGLTLVTAEGDEAKVTEAKKKLVASAMGLLLVIFSTVFIDKVFYVIDLNAAEIKPQIDAVQGLKELISITNIVVTIVGPIMVLMLVAGGVMYIVSMGDESKTDTAKKLITNAIIGIIVIYGAFAIVSTFISGQVG